VRGWVWLFGAWGAGDRRIVAISGCPVRLNPSQTVCVTLRIFVMLILSELFLTVYSFHF